MNFFFLVNMFCKLSQFLNFLMCQNYFKVNFLYALKVVILLFSFLCMNQIINFTIMCEIMIHYWDK